MVHSICSRSDRASAGVVDSVGAFIVGVLSLYKLDWSGKTGSLCMSFCCPGVVRCGVGLVATTSCCAIWKARRGLFYAARSDPGSSERKDRGQSLSRSRTGGDVALNRLEIGEEKSEQMCEGGESIALRFVRGKWCAGRVSCAGFVSCRHRKYTLYITGVVRFIVYLSGRHGLPGYLAPQINRLGRATLFRGRVLFFLSLSACAAGPACWRAR